MQDNPEGIHYANEVLKLCNISRKQLHYYEKKGLITNVPRNPENNYRYYTQTHITQLFIVKEYLSMGYSLDEIYHLLYESDADSIKRAANQRLQKAREDYLSGILQYEHSVARHSQIIEGLMYLDMQKASPKKDSRSIRCELTDYLPVKIVGVEGPGTPFDQLSWSQTFLSLLYEKMEKHRLKSTGPLLFMFRGLVDPTAKGLIPGEKTTLRAFPTRDVYNNCTFLMNFGGMQCASAIHVGGYNETMEETYNILLAWCREHQYQLSGDSIEQYLIGTEMTSNEELFVTKILLPLKE